MSDSLMKVVTPTRPAVGTESGSLEIACPALSVIEQAIAHCLAFQMGSDAAATPVDVESVACTAETFQCHELASSQRQSHASLAQLREATTALARSLGSRDAMLEALATSRTEPVFDGKRSLKMCGGTRSFRTRRGDVYIKLWHLFHPGERLLAEFYSNLEKSSEASISLDTMYTAAASALTWENCRAHATEHRDAFASLESLARATS